MIKFLSMLTLSLVLLGCGTPVRVTDTQMVNIPIITKCTPTTQVTPINDDPFDKVNDNMPLFDKVQLILASRLLHKGQNIEYKAALSECTK